MSIQYAALHWPDDQPFSQQFGDVYFSRDSGLDETRYVFLQHNALEQRWQALTDKHFTICETGFGTGLNFLCAWELWSKSAPAHVRLHFISCERYPLTRSDLEKALKLWPALAHFSKQLIAQYQCLSAGMHRLTFDEGRVQLTLLIGDASHMLSQLQARIDAWFLDGFAPSKNPDLWQPALFAQMARLSNQYSSFATFTSAGAVRRGLENAGFEVEKVAGFGRKREMLRGRRSSAKESIKQNPMKPTQTQAIVIGGGIAGCSSSHALATRGWHVTLIEQHSSIAAEASGNPAAMLYPRLAMQETVMSRLALGGFLYTSRLLGNLRLSSDDFRQCGLLQLAFDAREAARCQAIAKQALPRDILYEVDQRTASSIAGIRLTDNALYFPQAGWVKPAVFCKMLTDHHNIALKLSTRAIHIRQQQDLWQVWDNDVLLAEAPVLVIATANDSLKFHQTEHLPLQAVRGQVTTTQITPFSQQLNCVICTDGYISPAIDGNHCLGATFAPEDTALDIRAADHLANMTMLDRISPELRQSFNSQPLHGRAALRAATQDYLPLAGQLLDAGALVENPPKHYSKTSTLPYLKGLYINTGHGSKGISQAPICAELLASAICGEPLPADIKLTAALDPNRFLLRQLGLKRWVQGLAGPA